MAYDDDSSRFGFKDLVDLESLVERFFLSQPENLTLGRVTSAVQALDKLAVNRDMKELSVHSVYKALEQQGLGHLPLSTVVSLMDAIQPLAGKPDMMSRLTLKDLEGIFAKTRR